MHTPPSSRTAVPADRASALALGLGRAAARAGPASLHLSGASAAVQVSRDSSRQALEDNGRHGRRGRRRAARPGRRTPSWPSWRRWPSRPSAEILKNAWQLPIAAGRLPPDRRLRRSAAALWSHCHTGLDFAAPEGTPILAVANGVDHRDRLGRRLRQPDRDDARGRHRALVLPPVRVRRRARATRSSAASRSASSARPATPPARTCTSRCAPAAATRSTPSRRSSSTASAPDPELTLSCPSRVTAGGQSFSTGA